MFRSAGGCSLTSGPSQAFVRKVGKSSKGFRLSSCPRNAIYIYDHLPRVAAEQCMAPAKPLGIRSQVPLERPPSSILPPPPYSEPLR